MYSLKMYWFIILVLIREYEIISAMPQGYYSNPCPIMSTIPMSCATPYNFNPNPANLNVVVPSCDERLSIYNRTPGRKLTNLLGNVLSLPGVAVDTLLTEI
ncbi:uncharacterized protein LOC126780154 [Nymphalis io]|uniref:uncharacterized protein LOC126780154 n=1 Tax=Inachis io TaxID=171585 RepID=UPI002169E434|nr:uncharacterized protein LOC126780154 [Nymphalis io]